MSKALWTLRETRDLPAAVWQTFKDRAAASGHSPTAALARIIKRYLDRGFDDGAPEPRNSTTGESAIE
jgi:hypothetical protein